MSPSSMFARCTLRKRLVVRLGNRLFHQAFFQPDTQFAGDDLQDVLGLQRQSIAPAMRFGECFFGGRTAAGGNLVECLPHLR